MDWTAEITNDPNRDYELYIELLENEEYKARLQFNEYNKLNLVFYGGEKVIIPVDWLIEIVQQAKKDLHQEGKNEFLS